MKITDVKATVIEVPNPMTRPRKTVSQANFVQVFTDEGIEGDYLSGAGPSPSRGVAETIIEVFKPMIIGRDPFDRENLWQSMVARSAGGMAMNAVGAIDIALWDITGKATGLPVYKLLGGYRDKIRAYASILAHESPQAYADYAKELVARGYTAIKLHLRGTVQDHLEACRATREAVGDKVDVLLDVNCRYDRREALMVGRELEKMNFYWYEEPLPNTDIEGYRELCQALDIPIAATETLTYANPSHFIPYLTEHVADILRTDAVRGITLAKKVSDLCDAFNVKCELHGWGFATSQFANLHVAGATKCSDFFEKMEPGEDYDVCAKDTIQIDQEGFVHLPSKPGLGLEFDLDEIKKRTILTL
jgi:L-alanine-DL-glutamate epimerase-like enolase superfamily enzyme